MPQSKFLSLNVYIQNGFPSLPPRPASCLTWWCMKSLGVLGKEVRAGHGAVKILAKGWCWRGWGRKALFETADLTLAGGTEDDFSC